MDNIVIGTDIVISNGDIPISVSGDMALIGGDQNLIQALNNNLFTRYGELESDPFAGNMAYLRRTKLTPSGMKVVESDCRNALMYDERVKEVMYVNVERLGNMECAVSYAVKKHDDTIVDGSTSINLGEV